MAQRTDSSKLTQDEVDRRTNNCLFLVRNLRARAYKLHEDLFTSLEEQDTPEEMKRRIIPLCIKLNRNYDELESSASGLPDKTGVDKEKFERLKLLFQEEKVDTSHSELIDKLIRASNYNEGNYQINYFLSNLIAFPRRKTYSMIPHPVSCSKFDTESNPHATFETLLNNCYKDFQAKKHGIYINILEKNCSSSVFEVRSGHFMNQSRSKEFVCLQRVVVIENGGLIDKCSFYAPNEEVLHMDDFGEKRVDLRASSRYEVFRRLSINTNIYLLQNAPIRDYRAMFMTLAWIAKVYQVIETPCKMCKKVLKDFLPPTAYNPQNIRHTHHETCR